MIDPAIQEPEGPTYFVSDAHLGSSEGPPERELWLLELLQLARENATSLVVLGDLFDFWFEYRHAVPKVTMRIARALAECVEAGLRVYFFGGNHDFWASDWLRRELGLTTFDNPVHGRFQGRLVYLAHGDGLGPGDTGYKVLKKILRSRWAIAGYRALHPDLGIPLAGMASTASRASGETPPEIRIPNIVRDVVHPALEGEVSAMFMGHVHEAVHFRGDGKDFVLLGDWIKAFTHARMVDGEIRLYRRNEDGGHEAIAPAPFPDVTPRRR